MSLSESSPPALPTAGTGTFPPTHESSVDTIEVPAPEGSDRDGSDSGDTTPAAVRLSADLGVAPETWSCIWIKFVTCVETPTCTPPLTHPQRLERKQTVATVVIA